MKSAETGITRRAGDLASRFEGKIVTDEKKFANRLGNAVEKAKDQDGKMQQKFLRDFAVLAAKIEGSEGSEASAAEILENRIKSMEGEAASFQKDQAKALKKKRASFPGRAFRAAPTKEFEEREPLQSWLLFCFR